MSKDNNYANFNEIYNIVDNIDKQEKYKFRNFILGHVPKMVAASFFYSIYSDFKGLFNPNEDYLDDVNKYLSDKAKYQVFEDCLQELALGKVNDDLRSVTDDLSETKILASTDPLTTPSGKDIYVYYFGDLHCVSESNEMSYSQYRGKMKEVLPRYISNEVNSQLYCYGSDLKIDASSLISDVALLTLEKVLRFGTKISTYRLEGNKNSVNSR